MTVTIGIGLVLGLIVIGLLAIIVSGVQSLMKGKQDIKKIITMIVPFAVFGIAYAITGTALDAGVATMIFMLAAMVLTILLSGARSTFNL